MCEIYFAMATDGTTLDSETLWEVALEALNSSLANDDGWGAFNEKRDVMKHPDYFDWQDAVDFVNEYEGSEWVVLHLRFATSGLRDQKNTHPYTMRGYSVVHNGVADVTGVPTRSIWRAKAASTKGSERMGYWDRRSDTWAMLHTITQAPGKTTAEKIKASFDGMDGSFSVFLMDPEAQLFYFRDLSLFTFVELAKDNLILGATKRLALEAMLSGNSPWHEPKPRYITPEAETIYALSPWDGLTAVGKFNNTAWGWSYYDDWGVESRYGTPTHRATTRTADAVEVIDLNGKEPRKERADLDNWLFYKKYYGDPPEEDTGGYDHAARVFAELNAEREAEVERAEWLRQAKADDAAKGKKDPAPDLPLLTPGDQHRRMMAQAEAEYQRVEASAAEAERKAERLRHWSRIQAEHKTRAEADSELRAMRKLFGDDREWERQVEARLVDEMGMRELLNMLPAATPPPPEPSKRTRAIWRQLDDAVSKMPGVNN